MCTGLLPVLTGRDPKLTQFFPHRKGYLATIRFGLRTDTGDITGTVLETSQLPSEEAFREILPTMVGRYEQIPPMYSALHVDGVRLYELARQGVEVERKARPVEIFDLTYVDFIGEGEYRFSVTCSTGTYIRTLCEDLGAKLGLCATMSALRRTESNGFSLDNAHSLEEVVSLAEQGRLHEISIPVESSFSELSPVTIPQNGENYYLNGGILTVDRLTPVMKDGLYRAYSESSKFLGLVQIENRLAKAVFSLDETE
jgi:tRNA pseudouridine55 synthase